MGWGRRRGGKQEPGRPGRPVAGLRGATRFALGPKCHVGPHSRALGGERDGLRPLLAAALVPLRAKRTPPSPTPLSPPRASGDRINLGLAAEQAKAAGHQVRHAGHNCAALRLPAGW